MKHKISLIMKVDTMGENHIKFPNSNIKIKDAQKVELEILLEFDRICKKHNLNYFLYSGTLLGAIRHNGFIPWDDDIDVCMLRKDYDKFMKIAKNDLKDKYFLQNYKTDKNYPLQFAKLRKNNTLYTEINLSNLDMHHGVFIDIFPYDNTKPNTFLGNVQRTITEKMIVINLCRNKKRNMQAKSKLVKVVRMFWYYLLKIIPKRIIDTTITKVSTMFNKESTGYISDLSSSKNKTGYERFTIKKEALDDSIACKFEGYMFPVPEQYDYVLTKYYGDYMKLPPKEEQQPHHGISKISFNVKG